MREDPWTFRRRFGILLTAATTFAEHDIPKYSNDYHILRAGCFLPQPYAIMDAVTMPP